MLLRIVSGFLFVLGAVLLIKGLSFIYQIHNSKSWPKTEGVIVKSELGSSEVTQHGDVVSHDYNVSPRSVSAAKIEYQYRIGQSVYSSTRVSIGGHAGGVRAKDLLEKYPVGSKVKVYFNPKNVLHTTLETNQSISNFFGTLLSIALIITGILIFRFTTK